MQFLIFLKSLIVYPHGGIQRIILNHFKIIPHVVEYTLKTKRTAKHFLTVFGHHIVGGSVAIAILGNMGEANINYGIF